MSLQTKAGCERIPVALSDRYGEEIRDFSAAILEKRPPMLSTDESLRNMRSLERIMEQVRST